MSHLLPFGRGLQDALRARRAREASGARGIAQASAVICMLAGALAGTLCGVLPARADATKEIDTQAIDTEAKVKVAYVYNLFKFIEWPARPQPASKEPFTLCTLGSGPVAALLPELTKRTVLDRAIVVVPVTDLVVPPQCELLFIGRSEEDRVEVVLQAIVQRPILTVSDTLQFARRGGMVGFVVDDGRVKIEIGQAAVRDAGIKVRAKLLEVARVLP